MIKEKYPGAVSSQPTKKTSNGNTGKDGKKSGKGKGEKNGNKKLKIKSNNRKKNNIDQCLLFFCRRSDSGEQVLNNLATTRRLHPFKSGLYRAGKCSPGM